MSEHLEFVEAQKVAHGRGSGLRVVADPVDSQDFAGSVAEMAACWQLRPEGGRTLLADIIAGAIRAVPGCDHAAVVCFDDQEQLVSLASTGPETAPVIALQNELRQGPCRDTATRNVTIRSADVRFDERWPDFGLQAKGVGIASMLCTPLMIGSRSYGSLSMASGNPYGFDSESESLASIFAVHATIALATDERQASLQAALETRDLIGQAKGILMGRYGLSADRAFSVLVRESKNHNIKLRTVSQNLCATGLLPSDATDSPSELRRVINRRG